jgi:hypothetical protein
MKSSNNFFYNISIISYRINRQLDWLIDFYLTYFEQYFDDRGGSFIISIDLTDVVSSNLDQGEVYNIMW